MCRSEVLNSRLNHQFWMQIYSNADFINRSHLIFESFINVWARFRIAFYFARLHSFLSPRDSDDSDTCFVRITGGGAGEVKLETEDDAGMRCSNDGHCWRGGNGLVGENDSVICQDHSFYPGIRETLESFSRRLSLNRWIF